MADWQTVAGKTDCGRSVRLSFEWPRTPKRVLLGPIGHVPPAEYEEIHYKQLEAQSEPARLN